MIYISKPFVLLQEKKWTFNMVNGWKLEVCEILIDKIKSFCLVGKKGNERDWFKI